MASLFRKRARNEPASSRFPDGDASSEEKGTGEIGGRNDAVDAILQPIQQKIGVPPDALRGILASMDETELAETGPAKIRRLLEAKAGEFLSLRTRLRESVGDDPEVERLREAAAHALGEGHLRSAGNSLREARLRVHETRRSSRKQEAGIVAEMAGISKLQPTPAGYREAANLFGEAARLIAPEDAARAHEYQLEHVSMLHELGSEFDDADALREAVSLYERILTDLDRATTSPDWAKLRNDLGNALSALGEQESNMARFEGAVAAYREALRGITREREPHHWAMIQNNLGNALQMLGERESGTARLEEAVAAYREALKEQTREHIPLDWAMIQNKLGNALQILGTREGDATRLEQAIIAYREALRETTREHAPLGWATIQHNIGNTLSAMGTQGNDRTRFEEAVVAYREALKEFVRERAPFDWATIQHNLGTVLHALGALGNDTARLEEAIAAYREAISTFDENGASLHGEGTKHNLARAETLLRAKE
ncbi:MAG: tetratricopeptide repeat protein [Candidatus Accumulibacter sp.]|nr:tetratricopeptide repeat protein [Accumulibacter sp.]